MNQLLSPADVAALLGVKKSTVYMWTHRNYIPHIKLGKLVRFDESKILAWLEKKSSMGRLSQKVDIGALLDSEP